MFGKKLNKKQEPTYSQWGLPHNGSRVYTSNSAAKNWFRRIIRNESNVVRRPQFQYAVAGTAEQGGRYRRVRNICMLLVLCVVCCYGGWRFLVFVNYHFQNYLAAVRILPVEHLYIKGNSLVTDREINRAAQIVEHKTGMLSIRVSRLKHRLEAIPWVRRVQIEKNWPGSVVINVEEENPLALLIGEENGQQKISYIDAHRHTFSIEHSRGQLDFPVLTGLCTISDKKAREKALSDGLRFLRKVKGNNPYLPLQSLSEIHFTAAGEMIVYLVDTPFPVFLGKGNIVEKYNRLVGVLKPLYKSRYGKKLIETVSYIQMEYLEDKILIGSSKKG